MYLDKDIMGYRNLQSATAVKKYLSLFAKEVGLNLDGSTLYGMTKYPKRITKDVFDIFSQYDFSYKNTQKNTPLLWSKIDAQPQNNNVQTQTAATPLTVTAVPMVSALPILLGGVLLYLLTKRR